MAADVWSHALLIAAFPLFANIGRRFVLMRTSPHHDQDSRPETWSRSSSLFLESCSFVLGPAVNAHQDCSQPNVQGLCSHKNTTLHHDSANNPRASHTSSSIMEAQTTTPGKSQHLKWPSFLNIHKLVHKGVVFADKILALEKLDGSNLGIETSAIDGLVALHGRNSVIWQKGSQEEPWARKYGSVQHTLHPLIKYIPKLQQLTKNLLQEHQETNNAASIVFYGEWYHTNQPEPAWFPFGYTVRGGTAQTMTLQLYQKFLDHGLQPPQMLYSGGTIQDTVECLHHLMMDPPHDHFEGVFLTPACGVPDNTRYSCAKWKVSKQEEQPRWILENRVREEMATMIAQLHSVFFQKIVTKKQTSPSQKEYDNNKAQQQRQIELAFASVMSKSTLTVEEFRNLKKKSWAQELKRLQSETLADLEDQYTAVGEELPKGLEKAVLGIVVQKIKGKK